MIIKRKYFYLEDGTKLPISCLRTCPECKGNAYLWVSTIKCDSCGYRRDIFDTVDIH